jgi:hypothetical protein
VVTTTEERKMRVVGKSVIGMMLLIAACTSASENDAVTTPNEAISRARSAWKSISEKTTWRAVYSKEQTTKFEPYTATLKDGTWVVRGTVPPGYHGELLETRVRQTDGQVSVEVIEVK